MTYCDHTNKLEVVKNRKAICQDCDERLIRCRSTWLESSKHHPSELFSYLPEEDD